MRDELRLRGVSRTYDGVVAVDDVDLAIRPGEFHCLVGPNGSGKSTLLRIAIGLTRPTAGRVERPDAVVGCGFQRANVYRDLTVAENLDVFAALADDPDPDWRAEVVETLRLDRVRNRRAGDLSGGYRKTLDLALALLKRPRYLLLDEPLGDLDDVSKERVRAFLADYRDAGNAVLVSTHLLADFAASLDRLTLLHDGRVVLDRAREDLAFDDHDSLQSFYVERLVELERDGDDTA